MKRVGLAIDDLLYEMIESKAKENKVPVASMLLDIVSKNIKGVDVGDYETAAGNLKSTIELIPEGFEFAFPDLFSKKEIEDIAAHSNVSIQSVRSRLGKTFARIVKESPDIEKVTVGGSVKRKNGAAVYIRKAGCKDA